MSDSTISRPKRIIGITAFVIAVLAAAPVAATLVLLAIDGHPEGVLAALAGAAVPAVLWGAWRIFLLGRTRVAQWHYLLSTLWRLVRARSTTETGAKREVTPGRKVVHKVRPTTAVPIPRSAVPSAPISDSHDMEAAREAVDRLGKQLRIVQALSADVPLLAKEVPLLLRAIRDVRDILERPSPSAADIEHARVLASDTLHRLISLYEETMGWSPRHETDIRQAHELYMLKQEGLRRAIDHAEEADKRLQMISRSYSNRNDDNSKRNDSSA